MKIAHKRAKSTGIAEGFVPLELCNSLKIQCDLDIRLAVYSKRNQLADTQNNKVFPPFKKSKREHERSMTFFVEESSTTKKRQDCFVRSDFKGGKRQHSKNRYHPVEVSVAYSENLKAEFGAKMVQVVVEVDCD